MNENEVKILKNKLNEIGKESLILIISFTLPFLILAIAHFLFQLNGKMKIK